MISSPERQGERSDEEMEEPQTGCLLCHGVDRGWCLALKVSPLRICTGHEPLAIIPWKLGGEREEGR